MAYKIMGTTPSPFYTNMMIYYIMCDTPADLPSTISDIGYGTTIGYGSRADIISDSSKYIWNGSQWVRQTTGGGGGASSADQVSYDNTDSGLTATNVQDAIDELHTTDETQDNAIDELSGENANQQLEINYAINTGAKNLFPNTAVSQTIGGITFTVNGDGTVTANGTKTNNDWFILSENNSFDAGTYTLSDGLPNDTTDCQLIIATARSMSAAIMATAVNSRPQTKTFTTAQTGLYYAIRIASGKTVNNLTFKPMLRRAEITNSTYEPYAPTNRELYETKTDQIETNVIANLGAKNLLEVTSATRTVNGVTFTVNNDQTITVNGTNTGTSTALFVIEDIPLQSGIAYTLSGCPSGGSTATYYIGSLDTTNWQEFTTDIGNGNTATLNEPKTIRFRIGIRSGVTVNNLVFKPMLRRAEITDNTFVPYAPTNRELYEMILALQSGGSVQSVSSLSKLNLSRDETLKTDEIKETENITPLETNEIEETE